MTICCWISSCWLGVPSSRYSPRGWATPSTISDSVVKRRGWPGTGGCRRPTQAICAPSASAMCCARCSKNDAPMPADTAVATLTSAVCRRCCSANRAWYCSADCSVLLPVMATISCGHHARHATRACCAAGLCMRWRKGLCRLGQTTGASAWRGSLGSQTTHSRPQMAKCLAPCYTGLG